LLIIIPAVLAKPIAKVEKTLRKTKSVLGKDLKDVVCTITKKVNVQTAAKNANKRADSVIFSS